MSGVRITVVGLAAEQFVAGACESLVSTQKATFNFYDATYQPSANEVVVCDSSVAERCERTCHRVFPVSPDEDKCPVEFLWDIVFPIGYYSRSK